jgi:hypothetical protein
MTKIQLTKKIVRFVVGNSVVFATASVVHNNVSTQKPLQKVEAIVAAAVLGHLVAEHTMDWTDEKIDQLVAWYQANVKY